MLAVPASGRIINMHKQANEKKSVNKCAEEMYFDLFGGGDDGELISFC